MRYLLKSTWLISLQEWGSNLNSLFSNEKRGVKYARGWKRKRAEIAPEGPVVEDSLSGWIHPVECNGFRTLLKALDILKSISSRREQPRISLLVLRRCIFVSFPPTRYTGVPIYWFTIAFHLSKRNKKKILNNFWYIIYNMSGGYLFDKRCFFCIPFRFGWNSKTSYQTN